MQSGVCLYPQEVSQKETGTLTGGMELSVWSWGCEKCLFFFNYSWISVSTRFNEAFSLLVWFPLAGKASQLWCYRVMKRKRDFSFISFLLLLSSCRTALQLPDVYLIRSVVLSQHQNIVRNTEVMGLNPNTYLTLSVGCLILWWFGNPNKPGKKTEQEHEK